MCGKHHQRNRTIGNSRMSMTCFDRYDRLPGDRRAQVKERSGGW